MILCHPKQVHIFGTRSDLELGLKRFESEVEVKYARCDLYFGSTYEQYLSLLEWKYLGKNTTGSHITGPRFLIVPRNCEIHLEPMPQITSNHTIGQGTFAQQKALIVDNAGAVSPAPIAFDQYLSELEEASSSKSPPASVRYNLSQKLNPDSITFLPGGIYTGEKVLVCGHIGTICTSTVAQDLYRKFVMAVTRGFERIGSYRVGPEARRLMDEGYRMVTIAISSPVAYDLRRS